MRFGLQLCTLGAYADPRETLRAARAAEEAGWEALLVWDHLAWASLGVPSADPWVTLGACAAVTERILLGTAVTPVPRRRVQNLAQELATLSLASGGRVVFGAGLGGLPAEFSVFGEPADERVRAERLDDGLAVLALVDGSDRERNLVSPDRLRELLAGHEIDEVCFIGYSAGADLPAYAAAGATWWFENVHGEPADVVRRIGKGPPGETLLT